MQGWNTKCVLPTRCPWFFKATCAPQARHYKHRYEVAEVPARAHNPAFFRKHIKCVCVHIFFNLRDVLRREDSTKEQGCVRFSPRVPNRHSGSQGKLTSVHY